MEGCSDLACMPKGMGKLTNLHTLTQFVLGEGSSNNKQLIDDLKGLRALKKLKGCLKIKIQLAENEIKAMEDIRSGGGYLSKEYLNHVDIRFIDRYEVNRRVRYDYEEVLLEDLQPHSNLMVLELSGYNGLNMPGWVAFLPNLVRIELIDCGTLQHLSCMRNLHNLKVLDLENLPNLEYIENSTTSTDLADSTLVSFSMAEGFSFFPSLERLRLYNLQKLKGWWRSETGLEARKLCLSQLKTLFVRRCSGLKYFPLCPRVENLNLWDFNRELRIINSFDNLSSYFDAANSTYCVPKLSVVRVDNIGWLKSLPIDAFEHLSYMEINNDKEVENLEEVEELFRSCSSSLRCLCIEHCPKLRSLYAGLKHLTALETLYISRSPDISISDESEDNMNIWQQSLIHNLKSLQLRDLPKLVNLPRGMQYLAALCSLQISNCSGLKSLPSWMPKLASLSRLDIQVCSTWLVERCQNPNGADWPKIHHIPSVVIL